MKSSDTLYHTKGTGFDWYEILHYINFAFAKYQKTPLIQIRVLDLPKTDIELQKGMYCHAYPDQ